MLNDSLEKVAEEVMSCKLCRLSRGRRKAVPGEGPSMVELMFVGEAPGGEEDIQGKPFVGAAGQLLTKLLKEAGIAREQMYITNVVKCRPPGNRPPTAKEVEACHPYLERQMNLLKPKIICLLGATALHALTGKSSITTSRSRLMCRGEWLFYPTYHPAAIVRNLNLREVLKADFVKLKVELNRVKMKADSEDRKLHEFFQE